jgi:hypothetical protein
MAPPQDKRPDTSAMRSAAMLVAIPSLLIISPLVGFFLGNLGDTRFPHLALALDRRIDPRFRGCGAGSLVHLPTLPRFTGALRPQPPPWWRAWR